ncbi:MAG TPA: DPP IV N-terminal domain-containing protein, partial [Pyrinomonadaceae bacterium]|nr:DPP IV N-terminal domain-containing protein [Pyrinomonadaceae bacterium]
MRTKNLGILLLVLLALCPVAARAQGKMLTVEDIYDPAKKVNFSGHAPAELVWLKDGESYLQSRGGVLSKVNARTGEAAPFFDAAKMEAALVKVRGLAAGDARGLAHQDSYKLNAAQTAVLLNAGGDLVYYELGSDTATRLTNNAEAETEEDFSPDGRLVSFVRGNDLYVVDINKRTERRLTNTGGEKTL